MILLWVCAGATGADVTQVHSSWPMGLPTVNDSNFAPIGSGVEINCTMDFGETLPEITSINGLYMATKCSDNFTTLEGQVYELVPMNIADKNSPLFIPTRGKSVAQKRYERNGNVLDIVNVTHRNLNETANNVWGGITNIKLSIPQVGSPFLYHGQKQLNKNCKIVRSPPDPDLDGELLDGYGYLPFWASDDIDVPFCYYRYSADKTMSLSKESSLLYPNTTEPIQRNGTNVKMIPARNRGFYSDTGKGSSTFGSLMNMKQPSCSDSSNTLCLPGRCSMLDTNYLFRQSSKEHVYRFESLGTYNISTSKINPKSHDPKDLQNQVWAVVVLGRAQCDPMYGGGIVKADNPDEIKFPRFDNFNSSLWTRIANDGDNLVYTSDPFEDLLFMNNRGTISGLPTYAFQQWGPGKNPNPRSFLYLLHCISL